MCAYFFSYLLLLYIGRVHGAISGCTVLGEVHPVSAQNKSLISDTDDIRKIKVSKDDCRKLCNIPGIRRCSKLRIYFVRLAGVQFGGLCARENVTAPSSV